MKFLQCCHQKLKETKPVSTTLSAGLSLCSLTGSPPKLWQEQLADAEIGPVLKWKDLNARKGLIPHKQLQVGDGVWLHNPQRQKGRTPKFQRSWQGPYTRPCHQAYQ